MTLWTLAGQAPLSHGQILEWVASPPAGDLPDPGTELASPVSPALQAESLPLSHWGSPYYYYIGEFHIIFPQS